MIFRRYNVQHIEKNLKQEKFNEQKEIETGNK